MKSKDLIGRHIVALSTGERVNTVTDVVFDHDNQRVGALLVDEGGWFRAAKALAFKSIKSIGEDAIMIDSPEDVVNVKKNAEIAKLLEKDAKLLGMSLMTTDGKKLGRIVDVDFDERTGAITEYEASGGMFSDIQSGRVVIPASAEYKIGNDAMIIPLSAAQAAKDNPRGIVGAVKSVGNTVTGGVDKASSSVKSSVQNASTSVKDAVGGITDNLAEGLNSRHQSFVIGKISSKEIVADDGTVIIKKGEEITALHAEVAEWRGKLPALSAAVTTGAVAGLVGQTTGDVKNIYTEVAHATKGRSQEYVLGKTSNADIKDSEGETIIAKGEVITQEHIEKADAAGKTTALTTAATAGLLANLVGQATKTVKGAYEETTQAAKDKQKAFALGKASGIELKAEDESLIIAKGEAITAEHIEKAEAAGKLTALTGSVASSRIGGVLAGAFGQAREKVQGAVEKVAPDKASSGMILVAEDAVGLKAKKDLLTEDGSTLIAGGRVISSEVAAKAKELGLEQQLIDLASKEAVSPLVAGLSGVQSGASGLFGKAKNWLSDMQEESESTLRQREQEEEAGRIRESLGKPVTHVILAADDSVILNVGDIVTNKSVEEARGSNMLEVLLDSVNHEAVK